MPGITAAPLVGSTAGGTKVAVTAEGALPTLQKFLYCKFGDTTVVAESATFGAAAVSAVCVAPAAGGKGAVPLALSFDGLTYTDTGYEFVYHGELKIKQAYPSVGPLVGGTQVFLAMEGAPFPGAMGNGTTAWAKCAFDDKVVQAQIIKASGLSQVTCFAPAADFAGNVQLKVTIDGQLYSNAAKFTYLYKEDIDSKYGAMWGVHMSEFQGMEQKFRSTGTGAYHPGHEGVTDFYSFYGFYETGFYGFYEYNFYDFYAEVIHDLPADAPVPTDRVSELCMTALTPAVGPASGGTRVTIKMAGIVPENHDTFFCKFGDAVVVADAFYYMGSSPVIVCEAPAGSGTAKLSVSMDGETFTEGGAAFYYHADVGLGVAAPTAAATTGGANVLLELASDPMPGAFVSGITTVPATCKFDDVEVPAEYLHSSSGGKARVVCTTPAADAGVYKLKVSLDGQHYSEDAIDFTFLYDGEATTGPMMVKEGPFQQELEYSDGFYGDVEKFYSDFYNFFYFYQEFYAGDLYDDALGVPTYKPAAIPTVFDYLAFSPEYCLYFDAGANTALESLELRKGVLSPEFSPETQVYFSAVPKDIYCMQFSAAVADKGATFTVQGAKGKDYQFSDCIPLTVGENLVDIVVTGLDGSTKTYSVVMVRLAGTDSTLMSLELPGLAFAPAFSASMTGYTLSVPFSVSSTTVVVAATDVDADIKVDGSALASASSGTLLDTSGAVALSTGDTVITVSVTAEDKIGTSTYTITVTRDPGIRLTSLTLAPSSSANPWKGDGAGIDKVFDGYTYAYHLVTSPADSNAYVALTTENPAVGVQVAVSAISDGLYNQQTYVSGVVNTATNTVAMADGSSYAHVTSYSMFSKTAANNVCYLLAKERSTTETWAIYKFTSCTATSLADAMKDGLDLTGGNLGYSARLTAVAAGGSQNLGDNLHGPSSLATNLAVAYSGATLTVSDSGNQDATLAEYAVGTWTRLQGAATSVWETQCGSALLVGSGTTSVSISSGGSTNVCVPHGMQVVTITLSLQGFADRTYTVQIDRPSAESELMALTPSSGTLVPAFTSTTTAYRLEVAYTVSTASITPVAKSAEYAYIHYMVDDFDANDDGDMLHDDYYKTGAFAWAGVDLYYCGKNRDVAIEVSAQDAHLNGDPSGRSDGYWYGAGTKSQYAVQLYRMSNPIHAELTGIAVKQTNIQSTFATTMSPASFASATTTYTMSSDYSGATSAYLTITWNADQSIADGLDRAQWGGKVTGTAFVSSTQSISYSSSMESGTTALTVSSASNTADIGPFAVVEGQTNTVSITLTSCDTLTTKTYTVALGKLSLDDATLSNLVPTTGSLDSAFSKSDFAYAMVVDSYTTSVKFTATVAVGGATLQLDGTTITSGQEVTVTLADNTAAASTTAAVFKVIAVDGQSFKTYTVTITRQMGTKVGLTSFALTANGASLDANTGAVTTAVVGVVAPSPAWNVDTTSYTYTLAYSDQYVTFAPVLEDPKASVKVDFLGTGTVTTLTSGATSAIFPAGAQGCKPLHAQTCEISGCAEMPFSANGLTTTVTVTSHDGLTTRSYSLLIARPAPPTPALSSVRVATYGNTANPTVVEVFNSIDSDANACISDAELKSALASVQGGITDASVLYTIAGATGNACFNLALLETLLKQLATESAAPYNSFTTYGFVPTTAQAIVLAAADTYFRGKSVLSSANTYTDYASPLVQESAFRKVVFAPIANHPFSGQTGSGTQYFRDANTFTVLGTASASGCPTFFDYDYGTKDVAVYMGNAGGGASTTVTPTLSRPLAGSAQLSSVSSTDGTVTPTFAASTYAYSIPVSDLSVKTGTLTLGIATGASVAVTVASGTVTNVGPVYTVPLAAAADTVVTVVVTAADGSLGATYTVTFDKDNTLLKALSVADSNATAVTLTPVFAAPVDYQAHVTNYTTAGIVTSVDYIDVTATPAEATATVTLSGYGSAQTPIAQGNGVYRIPLTGGWKDFTLTITVAFGGSTRAYTLNVDAVETYPDPTKSTVVPPAVTTVKPTAFALSITAFTKEGLVATAGVFVCSVPVGTGTVAFSSTTDGTGKYTVAFTTLTTAKSYTYTCTLDGVTIVNGVGTFTIIAGDLGTSTTVELAETFVRGETALVFVTAKDSYGNKIEKADENKNMVATLVQVDTRVSTVLTLTPSSVAGRFSASITPPTSYTGKYQILLRLTPTGTTLTYTFETTRSLDTDPAKFWQLSVLPAYTAGAAQAVTVIPLTTAEYDAAAKFANGTFPLLTAEVKSGVDGAVVKTLTCPPTRALAPCSFDLGVNVAQAYSLSLFYGVGNKSPMGCGRDACAPSTFAVGPSVGLAAETTVTAVPATVAAGASTVVKVSVKDAFKNPAATSSIIVFFKDPVSKLVVPSNVTQDALGTYSATTVLVKQGTYDVEVKMGAAAIAFAAGVSTTVQVTAGPVFPLNTVVSGSGTQAKVTADDTLTLSATLRDALGNLAAGDATVVLEVTGPVGFNQAFTKVGTAYEISYAIKTAGTYTAVLKVNNVPLPPAVVEVVAGAVSFPDTVVQSAVPPYRAGKIASFGITLQDKNGNANPTGVGAALFFFQSTVTTATGEAFAARDVSMNVAPTARGSAGMYTVTFVATKPAGVYTVQLVLNQLVVKQTTAVTILPGMVDVAKTKVDGSGLLGGKAGELLTFSVTPADIYGNVRAADAVTALVTVTLPDKTVKTIVPTLTAGTAGTTVAYTSTDAGSVAIVVSVGGEKTPTAYSGTISPGPVSATQSTITGLSSCVPNQKSTFTITTKDDFGNAITAGGAPFLASLVQAADGTVTIAETPGKPGEYTVEYTITKAGTFNIKVELKTLLGLLPVGGSPAGGLAVEVLDDGGQFSAPLSTAKIEGTPRAGESATVSIAARTDKDIAMTTGGIKFVVKVNGALVEGLTTDNQDGTYLYTFQVLLKGSFTVDVFAESDLPANRVATLPLVVSAGAPAASTSTLFSESMSLTAGGDLVVGTVLNDANMNQVLYDALGPVPSGFSAIATLNGTQVFLTPALTSVGGIQFSGKLLFAGTYTVTATLPSTFPAPFKTLEGVTVAPGPVSPAMSTVGDFPATLLAAQKASVLVLPKDSFGNAVSTACQATVGVPPSKTFACQPAVSGPGMTIEVDFQDATTVALSVALLHPVEGYVVVSQQSIVVTAGAATAVNTFIESGQYEFDAGSTATFTVVSRDKFDNALKIGGLPIVATLSGTKATFDGEVTDKLDGTYTVSFGKTQLIISEGDLKLDVKLGDKAIVGSGATVKVKPAPGSPLFTFVSGTDGATVAGCTGGIGVQCVPDFTVTAGSPMSLKLSEFSVFGTASTGGSFTYTVEVAPGLAVGMPPAELAAAGSSITQPVFSAADSELSFMVTDAEFENSAGIKEGLVYMLTVKMAGVEISNSPVYFDVTSAAAVIDQTVVKNTKLETDESTGSDLLYTTLLVETYDQYGNVADYDPTSPLTLSVTTIETGTSISRKQVMDGTTLTGSFVVGIGAKAAGDYSVLPTLNGVDLGIQLVTILPGDIVALELEVDAVAAGVETTASFVGKDRFDNEIATETPLLLATQQGKVTADFEFEARVGSNESYVSVTDPAEVLIGAVSALTFVDGNLAVKFTPKTAGTLVVKAAADLDGTKLVGVGEAVVSAGAVDVSKVAVSGPGMKGALVSTAAFFSITPMDSFGNYVAGACADFAIDILTSSTATTSVAEDPKAASCKASYTLATEGSVSLPLTYKGAVFQTLTVLMESAVGDPDPAKSVVSGAVAAGGQVKAGSKVELTVAIVSTKDILVPDSQGAAYVSAAASAGGAAVQAGTVVDNLDGTYGVTFDELTSAVAHQIALTVGGVALEAINVTVTPGPLDLESSLEYGSRSFPSTSFTRTVSAGDDIPVAFYPTDEHENEVDYNATKIDSISVKFDGAFYPLTLAGNKFDGLIPTEKMGTFALALVANGVECNTTACSGTVTVNPGLPHVPNSIIFGDGLEAIANEESYFMLKMKDKGGNEVDASAYVLGKPDAFLTSVSDSNVTVPTVVTAVPQLPAYKIAFSSPMAGLFTASFSLFDENVTLPQFVDVQVGEVDPAKSSIVDTPTEVSIGTVTFGIEVTDAYENPITTDPLAPVEVRFIGTGDVEGEFSFASVGDGIVWDAVAGKYAVALESEYSGTYELSAYVDGVEVANSPVNVTLLPGAVDPAESVVSGVLANATVEVGTPLTLQVVAKDANANTKLDTADLFEFEFSTGLGGEYISTYFAASGPGTYTYAFTPTKAAEKATVTVGFVSPTGDVVDVEDIEFTVAPSTLINATMSTGTVQQAAGVTVGAPAADGTVPVVAVAGAVVSTVVAAKDIYGNPIPVTDAQTFTASVNDTAASSPPAALKADGTVEFAYTPTATGDFEFLVVLPGSPVFQTIALTVVPADVSTKSTISTAASTFTAGVESSFTLKLFDTYDNSIELEDTAYTAAGLASTVTVLSTVGGVETVAEIPSSIAKVGDEFLVSFTPTSTGSLVASVANSAGTVAIVSAGVPVVAGPVDATKTVVSGSGTESMSAGATAEIILETFDSAGNKIEGESSGAFTLEVTPAVASAVAPTVAFVADGSYRITFGPGSAADLGIAGAGSAAVTVSLKYDGTEFKSIPVDVFVAAGEIDGPSCVAINDVQQALGAIVDDFSVDDDVAFAVQARDNKKIGLATGDATLAAKFTVDVVPAPTTAATVTYTTQGLYLVTFKAEKKASYFATVKYDGALISNGEINFKVSAGAPTPTAAAADSADSALIGLASKIEVEAGSPFKVYLTIKDQYGNDVDSLGRAIDSISAKLDGGSGVPEVAGTVKAVGADFPAKVEVEFTADVVLEDYELLYEIAGAETTAATVAVTPGSFDYAKSVELSIAPVEPAITAGSPFLFVFAATDSFGNTLSETAFGALDVTVEAKKDGETFPGSTAARVLAELELYSAGTYTFTVAVAGETLLEFAAPVKAGPVDVAKSSFTGTLMAGAIAGDVTSLEVTPVDAYGNANVEAEYALTLPASFSYTVSTTAAKTLLFDITPKMFGDYQVDVQYDGQSLGGMPILVSIAPRSPPEMVKAEFSAELLSLIEVTFSEATNMANLGAGKDCTSFVAPATVAKLGEGAECSFPAADMLVITLGSGATILPVGSLAPDMISLDGNALRNADGNSRPVVNEKVLQPPSNVDELSPIVVVSIPTDVGVCEDLEIDASKSYVHGGRPMTFDFQVSGLDVLAVSQELNGRASDKEKTVTIDKNLMAPDSEMTFTVTVTNFLGRKTSASFPVKKSNLQLPTMVTNGDLSVLASDKVIVGSTAVMPGKFLYNTATKTCEENTGKSVNPLVFQWQPTVASANFPLETLPNNFLATLQKKDMEVPTNFLEAGKKYVFEVSGALASAPESPSKATSTVTVGYSPIEVSIAGGNRKVSSMDELKLDVVVTDPDEVNAAVTVQWDTIPGLARAVKKYLITDAALKGQLTIPADSLAAGTYTFTASVSKAPVQAGRTNQKVSVVITVAEMKVPVVTTTLVAPKKGIPKKGLPASRRFVADCATDLGTIAWSVTSLEGDLAVPSEGIRLRQGGARLVIKANTLSSGVKYTVTCTATTQDAFFGEVTSFSEMSFLTRDKPTSGSLTPWRMVNKVRRAVTKVLGDDDACQFTAVRDAISPTLADWVSKSPTLFYELQARSQDNSTVIKLGLPSATNLKRTLLPEGYWSFEGYVKTSLEPSSALDAPLGAFIKTPFLRSCPQGAGRRSLLQDDAAIQADLNYDFAVALAEGDVVSALSKAQIYGSEFGAASLTDDIKSSMAAALIEADKLVIETGDYNVAQSCSLQTISQTCVGLTFDSIIALAENKIKNIYSGISPVGFAQAPQDSYSCFVSLIDALMGSLASSLGDGSCTITNHSKHAETLLGLLELIGQEKQKTLEDNFYYKNPTLSMFVAESSAKTSFAIDPSLTIITGDDATVIVSVIDSKVLNEPDAGTGAIVGISGGVKGTFSLVFPEITVPDGYQLVFKTWDGAYDDTLVAVLSDPDETITYSTVDGQTVVTIPSKAESLVVVPIVEKIPYLMEQLEVYATPYSGFQATSAPVKQTFAFIPTVRNYTFNVGADMAFAGFKGKRVEGATAVLRYDGAAAAGVDVTAKLTTLGELVPAGPIKVHKEPCLPGGTCVPAGAESAVTISLIKGDMTEPQVYRITFVRPPSTTSSLKGLKVVVNGKSEKLYTSKGSPAVAFSPSLLAAGAYLNNAITTVSVELQAEANFPVPYFPHGAALAMAGAGFFGAGTHNAVGGNLTAPIGDNADAKTQLLVGVNPVLIEALAQSGASTTEVQLGLYRMGKPVFVSERYVGLSLADFESSQEAQDTFIAAKAKALGVNPEQIEIYDLKKGSVIFQYVIYPVVETVRQPEATDEQRAQAETAAETANLNGAVALFTKATELDGQGLDFGKFGGTKSTELRAVELPKLPLPADFVCPACPPDFESTGTSGNNVCQCVKIITVSTEDLNAGEIAGIAIGSVAFVALVGGALYYWYNKKKQAAKTVLEGTGDEEEEEEVLAHDVELEEET